MCRSVPAAPPLAGYNPADVPPADYSIAGSPASITFGVFSALGTVAFAFGDVILVEIQVRCTPSLSLRPACIVLATCRRTSRCHHCPHICRPPRPGHRQSTSEA